MKKTLTCGIFCLLLSATYVVAQPGNTIQKVAPTAFKKVVDSLQNRQLIDVRTPEEFEAGHLSGASNINIYDKDFAEKMGNLNKSLPVMVYCKGGGRSANAAKQLQEMGFEKIYDLEGGILNWENKKLPLEQLMGGSEKDAFTVAQYDSLLMHHPSLMVDFYAPWCMPCREMEPSLKRLAKQYKGKVVVYRINVDNAKELARLMNINGIPAIVTYRNGAEINRVTGFQTAASLRNLANELTKLK